MQYTPKSSSEIAAMRLKPEGNYAFEVANAVDTVSKSSGKDMMALTLNVFDTSGAIFSVTDYLVPGTPYGDRKTFEFAATIGLGGKYATGNMTAEDVLGKGGWCKIKIGKASKKPDGKEFPPKNEVAWYLDKEPTAKGAAPASASSQVPENVQNNTAATGTTDNSDTPF